MYSIILHLLICSTVFVSASSGVREEQTTANPGIPEKLISDRQRNRLPLRKNILLKQRGYFEWSAQTHTNYFNQDVSQSKGGATEFENLENKQTNSIQNLRQPFQPSGKGKLKKYSQYFKRQGGRNKRNLAPDPLPDTSKGSQKRVTTGSSRYKITQSRIKRTHTNNSNIVTANSKNHFDVFNEIQDNENLVSHLNNTKQIWVYKQHLGKKSRSACDLKVKRKSKGVFQSTLKSRDPDFVQFSIDFCNNSRIKLRYTDDVFQAERWFWTYNSTSGPYPFMSWGLDYGILSFHLLEAKTVNVPYVCFKLESKLITNCHITLGEHRSSEIIAKAMIPLVNIKEGEDYYRFPANYFCYLSTRQDYNGTFHYWSAIYLYYPINYIYYKCCAVSLNYDNDTFGVNCEDKTKFTSRIGTWAVTKRLPYILGVLLLLYFPVMFFKMTAWLAKDEKVHGELGIFEMTEDLECLDYLDEHWQFADGHSPLPFGELLSFKKTFGLGKYPVFVSRLRRLLFVLYFPVFIYLQLLMYSEGMGLWQKDKIKVKDLVKVGTPMGFLSILGNAEDRKRVFVPLLGGPVGIVVIYYVLSLLFIAFPRSVKQVVEEGLPSSPCSYHTVSSPLFFGTNEIIFLSRINMKPYHLIPGYTKAETLMKCRFYMLFTQGFWLSLLDIQKRRILVFFHSEKTYFCSNIIMIGIVLPLYLLLCAVEIACCIVFYSIPFCSFVSIMINGSVKSLRYFRDQSTILLAIFKYRFTAFIGGTFVFVIFMVYIYVISLVFIISFVFIFQLITYCFVAIIVYPSVAFGYLFFFVVLLYYFIKLVRSFGDRYTELLASTVDVSRCMSEEKGTITIHEGELRVSNVRAENIVDVRINDKLLHLSTNVLKSLRLDSYSIIKEKDNTYGVPKDLFEFIVKKHRPVHQQVLVLCMKAAIMITFVCLTLTITSNYVTGPTNEISEVMHVVFIVAVGAVPQLVQAVLSRSDTVLAREIEEREIKKSVIEFWRRKSEENRVNASRGTDYYQNVIIYERRR